MRKFLGRLWGKLRTATNAVMHDLFGLYNRPIIWMATTLHVIWGLLLTLAPSFQNVKSFGFIFNLDASQLGTLFLLSSVASIAALAWERAGRASLKTFWMLWPQQTLLILTAAAAIHSVILDQGGYSRVLLFAGQLPVILLAVFHPFGVLRMHWDIMEHRGENGAER